MDMQLLQAFMTVAEQRSFSLAADQLKLTQSAISKRIALLEEQLSCLLFDRMGRQVVLTEAGARLLPHAQQLTDNIEATIHLMKEQQNKVSGKLRIATSHHIGIHRLPPFLERYTQHYPDVHLDLHFLDSEQATHAILQGEFDLALITLPDLATDDGTSAVQFHPLWQDPMQLVVGRKHPLCNKSRISLSQLSNYPAILPDTNTRTTQLVKSCFEQFGHTVNLAMTTNHLDAIKMMVGIGLGWSALPERLVDDNVYPLPIKKISLSRQLGCIHARHRTLSNAARAMLNCLQGKKPFN